MSKRRMHDSRMWESEKFAQMPSMARLLMVALIDVADDQGRFRAHPAWLRSQVFPYDDVTLADISGWLELISKNETVLIYESDGQWYGQLVNWWKYQRPPFATVSTYPEPEGWRDRIRVTVGGGPSRRILTHNWVNLDGTVVPDTCNAQGEHLLQTPIPNTYSEQVSEHLDDKKKKKDKDKDKDKEEEAPAFAKFADTWYSRTTRSGSGGSGFGLDHEKLMAVYDEWMPLLGIDRLVEGISIAAVNKGAAATPAYLNGIYRRMHKENGKSPPSEKVELPPLEEVESWNY